MTTDSPALTDRSARIVTIVLILLAGVMTGAQLGKIAPLILWYADDVGLTLIGAGWLAAMLGVFIALAAMPSGWVIDRIGLLRAITLGVGALVVGGVVLALSTAPSAIFAARLVEALGYLALCVGLPAALNALSPVNWKGPVLAIWSGFVPLGFATSDFLAAALLPLFSPSVFLLTITIIFAGFASAALVLLRGFNLNVSAGAVGGIVQTLSREVVLLAVGFGAFVVLTVSLFTFMPLFVGGEGAHYLVSAGAVALSVPIGNVLASVLVRGRDASFMAQLAIAGFAICIVSAVPAFTLADPFLATLSIVALAISGAVVASAQYAAIPFITPSAGSVAVAFGLVAQAGGIGTLFGPPIAAYVVESFGWVGFSWFLAGTAVVGLACMVPLVGLSAVAQPPRR